jgi:hypothetical protein
MLLSQLLFLLLLLLARVLLQQLLLLLSQVLLLLLLLRHCSVVCESGVQGCMACSVMLLPICCCCPCAAAANVLLLPCSKQLRTNATGRAHAVSAPVAADINSPAAFACNAINISIIICYDYFQAVECQVMQDC